jgi:hypothetical protein
MNFLALSQKVALKADLTSGMTTTISQVGVLAKIVDWVVDAYDEIQGAEKWWTFQTKRDSATMMTGVDNYAVSTFFPNDFDFLHEKSVYYNIIGNFSGRIDVISWEDFTETYLYVALSPERPTVMAFDPTGQVYFNTSPDDNHVIRFDYQQRQQHFTANLDIPVLPEDYHDLIWRLALIKYGEHYGAAEVYVPAQDYYEDRMQLFKNQYLPKMKFTENVYHGYNTP